ncbi:protein stum homolog [Rhinoraja longicauda]
MNPDETGQDQSGIRATAKDLGSDQDLSGVTIAVTDPGLNQDQSVIRAGAGDPTSDPDTNQDQTRALQGSLLKMPGPGASSPGSVRKGQRYARVKRKGKAGAAEAGCCTGETRWAIMNSSTGVVVEVREKRSKLRLAIPTMPFPLAVFCFVLNTFLPGMGTFVSAFAVLCGAPTDLYQHHVCVVFLLNVAAALIQLLTALVIVGWIMSIFWGMDMVSLTTNRIHGTIQRLGPVRGS